MTGKRRMEGDTLDGAVHPESKNPIYGKPKGDNYRVINILHYYQPEQSCPILAPDRASVLINRSGFLWQDEKPIKAERTQTCLHTLKNRNTTNAFYKGTVKIIFEV